MLAALFIFNTACGGTSVSCVSSSGRGCVPSNGLSVDIDVGLISDERFSDVSLVFDNNNRIGLNENTTDKFTLSFSKGNHTVFAEYYRDGTRYTTDSQGLQKLIESSPLFKCGRITVIDHGPIFTPKPKEPEEPN